MNTIVVAFSDKDMVDNFATLPSDFGDYRIVTHNDPKCFASGVSYIRNYDILITSKPLVHSDGICKSDPKRTIVLPRYRKSDMISMMNEFATDNSLDNYKYGVVWEGDDGIRGDIGMTVYSGSFIIKPQNGARGICQFFFEQPVIGQTIRHDWDRFKEFLSLVNSSIKQKENEECTYDFLLDLVKQSLKTVFKEQQPQFTGFEEKDCSFIKSEFTKLDEWFITEFVPNVDSEYRVITATKNKSNNRTHMMLKREIKTNAGFNQAIGSNRLTSTISYDALRVSDKTREEIRIMLDNFFDENNSVDLFITNDDKFGFFEYSNQFGTKGVSSLLLANMQAEFIVNSYERALGIKPI